MKFVNQLKTYLRQKDSYLKPNTHTYRKKKTFLLYVLLYSNKCNMRFVTQPRNKCIIIYFISLTNVGAIQNIPTSLSRLFELHFMYDFYYTLITQISFLN